MRSNIKLFKLVSFRRAPSAAHAARVRWRAQWARSPGRQSNYRYMVASSDIAITPLSRWVSLLFTVLRSLALSLWTETQKAAGIPEHMIVPPWLILTADTLFDKLKSASISCNANSRQFCFDVQQFYTHIPHSDLKSKLRYIVDRFFQHHVDNEPGVAAGNTATARWYLVIYSKNSAKDDEWLKLTNDMARDKECTHCKVFSVEA